MKVSMRERRAVN